MDAKLVPLEAAWLCRANRYGNMGHSGASGRVWYVFIHSPLEDMVRHR